jgi:hypothetical protein
MACAQFTAHAIGDQCANIKIIDIARRSMQVFRQDVAGQGEIANPRQDQRSQPARKVRIAQQIIQQRVKSWGISDQFGIGASTAAP